MSEVVWRKIEGTASEMHCATPFKGTTLQTVETATGRWYWSFQVADHRNFAEWANIAGEYAPALDSAKLAAESAWKDWTRHQAESAGWAVGDGTCPTCLKIMHTVAEVAMKAGEITAGTFETAPPQDGEE